jgi:hypothetical protein
MDTLAFCAFRYALGRKTYIVSDVVDELIAVLPQIEKRTKEQMVDEIVRACNAGVAGMKIDIEEWERLAAAIEEETSNE